jgi:hypothetical protein
MRNQEFMNWNVEAARINTEDRQAEDVQIGWQNMKKLSD